MGVLGGGVVSYERGTPVRGPYREAQVRKTRMVKGALAATLHT